MRPGPISRTKHGAGRNHRFTEDGLWYCTSCHHLYDAECDAFFRARKFIGTDIGCGTGILGIYAANRNSIEVGAYDFDEWSVANTIENAGLNSVDKLEVWLGDVDSIPKRTYDYILANINLNTLRDQLESYLKHLNPNGLILMSGVLATDRKALQELAQALNLKLVSEQTRENWLQQTYGWN